MNVLRPPSEITTQSGHFRSLEKDPGRGHHRHPICQVPGDCADQPDQPDIGAADPARLHPAAVPGLEIP